METAENRVSLAVRGLAFQRGKTIIKKEKIRQLLAMMNAIQEMRLMAYSDLAGVFRKSGQYMLYGVFESC